MTLIKFESRNIKMRDDLITIGKAGTIGLPSRFCNVRGIKKKDCAVLYWDNERPRIAIVIVNEQFKGSFPITLTNSNYGIISAKSFLKLSGIDSIKQAGQYPYTVEKMESGDTAFVVSFDDKGMAETN